MARKATSASLGTDTGRLGQVARMAERWHPAGWMLPGMFSRSTPEITTGPQASLTLATSGTQPESYTILDLYIREQ